LDPEQQRSTRRLCLSCPRLALCRKQTLDDAPLHGMWAGVWIDHDFETKRHLLALMPPQALLPRPAGPPPTPLVSALPVMNITTELQHAFCASSSSSTAASTSAMTAPRPTAPPRP
ncbi:WhiB family transcriptional regulator, partial [Mycobacteroides abscessus]|uniref:WhiB family transcriptional regulator n=1 Tax=Mycobacteroides abscessus TaxID=36809 RepID=UPI001A97141D